MRFTQKMYLTKHLTKLQVSIIATGEAMVSLILSSSTEDTYAVNLALDIWEP